MKCCRKKFERVQRQCPNRATAAEVPSGPSRTPNAVKLYDHRDIVWDGPLGFGHQGDRSTRRPNSQLVRNLVERFDRRGIEPFELFRSEFGQNSVKIQECSLENLKKSEIFNIF